MPQKQLLPILRYTKLTTDLIGRQNSAGDGDAIILIDKWNAELIATTLSHKVEDNYKYCTNRFEPKIEMATGEEKRAKACGN